MFNCFKKKDHKTPADTVEPNHPPVVIGSNLNDLQRDYVQLWNTCKVRETKKTEVNKIIDKIMLHLPRYKSVEAKTEVPWYMIACIHNKESSLRFSRNLMNGQKLSMVTTIVPKGKGPWETWEKSAYDALVYDDLAFQKYDAIYQILEALERYNGMGYRKHHAHVKTPYLWSGTNHYSRGGYPRDGHFSDTHVSVNPGCCAILKEMKDRGIIT